MKEQQTSIENSDIAELPLKGIHLLLAEDIKMNQLVAKKLIEKLGATVDLADNGQHAIDKIAQENYHAILMDLHMPVMDGFVATRLLKAKNKYKNIPVIGLTGDTEKDSHDLCKEVGMNAVIVKPFAPTELVSTVKTSIFKSCEHSH